MADRIRGPAEQALRAGQVEQDARVVWSLLARLRQELDGFVVLLRREEAERRCGALPLGGLERLSRAPADHQHCGLALRGDRLALCGRVADEDERAGARVESLTVDGEGRAAFDDDVELLVLARSPAELVVLFDDLPSGLVCGPGIDAEGTDPQVMAHGRPAQVLRQGRQLHLRQRCDLVPVVQDCLLSSSSTMGSIDSAPSTRSSRFSLPAQRKRVSPSSPS